MKQLYFAFAVPLGTSYDQEDLKEASSILRREENEVRVVRNEECGETSYPQGIHKERGETTNVKRQGQK